MSKLKFHNKIAVILSSGNVVSVDEIKQCFANDEHAQSLLYRLSTYIYDIRKFENGIIKVFKNGRNVTGYQLINSIDFDSEGRNINLQPSKTTHNKQPTVKQDVITEDTVEEMAA